MKRNNTTPANKAGNNNNKAAKTTAPETATAQTATAETSTEATTEATADETADETSAEATAAEATAETVIDETPAAEAPADETAGAPADETPADEPVTGSGNAVETAAGAAAPAETTEKKRVVNAKPAPTVTTAKRPPMAAGTRGGGGGRTRSTAPTYNVGTCMYADLQPHPKTGERKFLEFILSGAYFPTFNGDPNSEAPVDPKDKVYKSLEEAQKDGAVLFGIKPNVPKPYSIMQNAVIQDKHSHAPTTGLIGKDGKIVRYHCFITATKENIPTVVANMNAYINCPYRTAGNWPVMFEVLNAPYNITIPPVPVETSVSIEPAAATADKATAEPAVEA